MRSPFLLLLVGSCIAGSAHANVGEYYGFGSRSAALAGAVISGSTDGFASYYNPALMPLGKDRLTLSWGMLAMEPSFIPIQNIELTNAYTAEKTNIGDVDMNYRTTSGQLLGLSYRFDNAHRISIGFTSFIPLSQLAFMDTGEVFAPEYVLDRSRTQRPQFNLALGGLVTQSVSAGLGIQIAFALTAKADVSLQTETSKPSSMRFTSSLKPKASPYFGLLFAPDGEEGFSAGAVVRLASTSDANMDLTSAVNLPAVGGVIPFIYHANSALYYDPFTVQLGATVPWTPLQKSFFEVDYEAWRNFKVPVLTMTRDPQGAELSDSRDPTFSYQDLVVPKVGHEMDLGFTRLRIGYSYRQSILKEISNGPGNYLDPPRHMISAGAGWEFRQCLGLNAPCNLDLHLSYHALKTQRVEKTPGDESGSGTGAKVGSPGYDAGGKIYGGGVSLTLKI